MPARRVKCLLASAAAIGAVALLPAAASAHPEECAGATPFRAIHRGTAFTIETPQAGQIRSVALTHTPSVTHGYDFDNTMLRIGSMNMQLHGIENPDIDVLGHPRCRIYNFRVGLLADWKTVLEAAADNGTAVEIDGFPDRQDLNVELLELAEVDLAAAALQALDDDLGVLADELDV